MKDRYFETTGGILKWIEPAEYWNKPYWTYAYIDKDESGEVWDIVRNTVTGEYGYTCV